MCELQTQFIISLMEVYEHNRDANRNIMVNSQWLLDEIHNIFSSVDGPKRKQVSRKSGEWFIFIHLVGLHCFILMILNVLIGLRSAVKSPPRCTNSPKDLLHSDDLPKKSSRHSPEPLAVPDLLSPSLSSSSAEVESREALCLPNALASPTSFVEVPRDIDLCTGSTEERCTQQAVDEFSKMLCQWEEEASKRRSKYLYIVLVFLH